jgi:hypothetical protein
MNLYLTQILAQLSAVAVPDDVPGEGVTPSKKMDVVVGELPDELRRLYVVLDVTNTELKAFEKSVPPIRELLRLDQRTLKEMQARKATLVAKHQLLRDLFWNEVRLAFPVTLTSDQNCIALRQGWKVVEHDEEPNPLHAMVLLGVMGSHK